MICRKATVALLDANYLSSVPIPVFPSTKSAFLCAFASKFFPDGTPGQQQTSSGGEKYSGLASNPEHLGRISTISSKPSKKEKLNHPFPNASTYNLQELCRKGMLAPEESIYKRYDSPSHSAQLDGHPFHYDR